MALQYGSLVMVQFTVDDTSNTLDYTGTNDVIITITVVSSATGTPERTRYRRKSDLSQANVDNFEFGVIQDSLGQSMGTAIPNRALMLVCGGIGSGKSIIGQRMSFGMTANDVKVSLYTTELTTRGWLEQVSSIGYYMDKRIDEGSFHLISSFGVIAEPSEEPVSLLDLLESPASKEADVVIVDRASELMPDEMSSKDLCGFSVSSHQRVARLSSLSIPMRWKIPLSGHEELRRGRTGHDDCSRRWATGPYRQRNQVPPCSGTGY